jgi:hypothetical protein
MPAEILGRRQGQSHRDVETYSDRRDVVRAADPAQFVGDGERRAVNGGAGVHAAAFVQGVVEIKRVSGGGVGLSRRQC